MILSVKGLNKNYKKLKALNNISFDMNSGEVIGLLGHNGAGKSTLIKCLIGAIRSYSGSIQINGIDISVDHSPVKKYCGFLLEPSFCYYLSARKNLELLNSISVHPKKNRTDEVLAMVSLHKVADKKVSEFSFGMKQRLGLAQVLLSDPQLVVLDEPTVGLDPLGIDVIKKLIANLSQKGVAVLFSSHQINDVFDVCSRAIVMNEGNIVFDDSADKLMKKKYSITVASSGAIPKSALKNLSYELSICENIISFSKQSAINPILALLLESGCTIEDFDCNSSLECLKGLMQR